MMKARIPCTIHSHLDQHAQVSSPALDAHQLYNPLHQYQTNLKKSNSGSSQGNKVRNPVSEAFSLSCQLANQSRTELTLLLHCGTLNQRVIEMPARNADDRRACTGQARESSCQAARNQGRHEQWKDMDLPSPCCLRYDHDDRRRKKTI